MSDGDDRAGPHAWRGRGKGRREEIMARLEGRGAAREPMANPWSSRLSNEDEQVQRQSLQTPGEQSLSADKKRRRRQHTSAGDADRYSFHACLGK